MDPIDFHTSVKTIDYEKKDLFMYFMSISVTLSAPAGRFLNYTSLMTKDGHCLSTYKPQI